MTSSCTAEQSAAKKYKIVILWSGLGELELAKRMEQTCAYLGWRCQLALGALNFDRCEQAVLDHLPVCEPAPIVIRRFQPDFIIHLKHGEIFSDHIPLYLALTGNLPEYFDGSFQENADLLDFDGILYSSGHIHSLKQYFKKEGKTFHGIDWYVSCPATPYQPSIPRKLFYCGFQWDAKRNGSEYRKMFSLLEQKGNFVVYGLFEKWRDLTRSYRGLLPFDGKSVCNAIREAGITLVLHTQSHLELGAPSSRVFEGASACSVIISDRHPFILKEFGDSVLYIDESLSGEKLFHQIDAYMEWIFSHPAEAALLARKAHLIFNEKFTLEKQMQNVGELHEGLSSTHTPTIQRCYPTRMQ